MESNHRQKSWARHRVTGISVAALTAALVATCTLLLRRPPLDQRVLPDGTVVRLEAVTYGTSHHFLDGTVGQRLAHRFLPARIADWLGGRDLSQTTSTPQLVCWLRSSRGLEWLGNHGIVVAGENGCLLDWTRA